MQQTPLNSALWSPRGIAPLAATSAYSFGVGFLRPETLVAHFARLGYACAPLTDVMGLWGLVGAMKAAEKAGVRLLAGIRVPLAAGELWLYPRDESGYRGLCRLIGAHWQKLGSEKDLNAAARPLDINTLNTLVGTGRAIVWGESGLSAAHVLRAQGWTCWWGVNEETRLAPTGRALFEKARALKLLPVVAPECVAARGEHRFVQRLVRAIHQNVLFERLEEQRLPLLPPAGELDAAFSWISEGVAANLDFQAEPAWLPPLGEFHMPKVNADPRESAEHLRALALAGLRHRYDDINEAILSRFEKEFAVICQRGFADYFLLVQEIVLETERCGHRVLGRGSAANSLISYALRLTHVDPLKYGLFFERFLNPERASPPDIDLDFSWNIRDDIYAFLRKRWGTDQVALISTHVTLRGRAALWAAGKALGYPPDELKRTSIALGSMSVGAFREQGAEKPESRGLPFANASFQRLLQAAALLEGLPNHISLHAGGVVVAPGGMERFCPVQPSSKALPMTQFEMHAIEAVGLVKIDILAQRSLGVFADVTRELAPAVLNDARLDDVERLARDPKVATALRRGRTMGVFYIESPGMRMLLEKLDCRGFEELTAASSVIRPGVAESGMMQAYIERHRDRSRIPPGHPLLRDILAETHGVMIYQEDVMKVVQAMAGLSLAEADLLRRAMSGKQRGPEAIERVREQFLAGASAKGVAAATAQETWRQIESFAGYAFCKAHSASYAVLSLQLLWMKQYYPALFMARVMDNRGGFYGTQAYIFEARRLGVEVCAPDVRCGNIDCLVQDKKIWLGLSFVKNLSAATLTRIAAAARERPFAGAPDFHERIRPSADEWENLLDSGALKAFGTPAACRWQVSLAPRRTLFDEPVLAAPPAFAQKPLSRAEWVRLEQKATDLVLSAHPLDFFDLAAGVISSRDLLKHEGRNVALAGVLIAGKTVMTKKGERMKFLSFDDRVGTFEATLFPKTWKAFGHLFLDRRVFVLEGRVECEGGVPALNVGNVRPIRDALPLKGPR